jgi:hypothetical protein
MLKFKRKLNPLNKLKCTTAEKAERAVAWTLKLKLKFRLKFGLNLSLF